MLENTFPYTLFQFVQYTWVNTKTTLFMCPLSSIELFLPIEENSTQLKEWLSDQEHAQLAGYKIDKRKREWLAGRMSAKSVAIDYLQKYEKEPPPIYPALLINNETSGRPFLLTKDKDSTLNLPDITISHSNEFAAAMAANSFCGIDIQCINEKLHKTKSHFCNDQESELLSFVPDSTMALALLWSSKEAIKKALSFIEMPGFREINLMEIAPSKKNFHLKFTIHHPNLPTTVEVVAGSIPQYAIAICITDFNITHGKASAF